ncbi:MAG TPA: molybdopterin-dependent oxidoreductase [Acetobacteraceae bacterium]|nr:molybdopterin-dependent oxidoreductase [Acetobacteraceae bacterium]
MPITRRDTLGALVASFSLAAGSGIVRAATPVLPLPKGKPVLVVSGRITVTNLGKTAVFDMPTLEALGLASITTGTPWDQGKVTFTGVPLTTLLGFLGANGTTLVASALNDYSAELPISDFAKYHTLLATRRNGQYMPVSDKGPLFIVYPFDSDPDLRQQTYYGRSVWQINKLTVQ